jgi:hypothetical protein
MGAPPANDKNVKRQTEDADDDGAPSGRVAKELENITVVPPPASVRIDDDSHHRARLVTITDEVATERARIASVLMDSTPPRRATAPIAPPAPQPEPSSTRFGVGSTRSPEIMAVRAKLAPMSRVPVLAHDVSDLGSMIKDPKMAYILGFVDGILPLETIVEVAGLPEIEALGILDRAIVARLVTFA